MPEPSALTGRSVAERWREVKSTEHCILDNDLHFLYYIIRAILDEYTHRGGMP